MSRPSKGNSHLRLIRELQSAILLPEKPAFLPTRRKFTSSQAKGLTFERKIGRYLSRLAHGADLFSEQWFCYFDSNGVGYAQTDHYLVFATHVLLIECKLTQRSRAFPQMGMLYRPILQYVYEKPVVGVQACRNIHFVPDKYFVPEIAALFEFNGIEELYTWHAYGV